MSDLISRQAALNAIEKLLLPQARGETAAEEINRVAWRCAINCAEEMIGHLPTIEAEQTKRGEWWLQKIAFKGGHGQTATKYKCSACKGYSHKKSPFCPNCGAKMDEVEE